MEGKKVIAVDFDGTLFSSAYPEIVSPVQSIIDFCKHMKSRGHYLILWSCREGELLNQAIEACKHAGIEFDAVNENLPHRIEQYQNDPRKIGADYYLDDKSMSIYEADAWNTLFGAGLIPGSGELSGRLVKEIMAEMEEIK